MYAKGLGKLLAETKELDGTPKVVTLDCNSVHESETNFRHATSFEAGFEHISGWPVVLHITARSGKDDIGLFEASTSPKKFTSVHVGGKPKSVSLNLLSANSINLSSEGAKIEIINTNCLHLVLAGSNNQLKFVNCRIGNLEILNAERSSAHFENCELFSLRAPREIRLRDIKLQRVNFPAKLARQEKISGIAKDDRAAVARLDRASFGFLQDWATNASNSDVAHQARGMELKLEYHEAPMGFEKLLLGAWGLFGNFGLSPLRPLVLVGVSMFLTACAMAFYGTSLGLTEEQAVGWRSALAMSNESTGNLARAIVGSLEGLVSPLSVFSSRRIVIPDSPTIAIAQVLHGYFSLSMVLLFGFSIRRRFKLS